MKREYQNKRADRWYAEVAANLGKLPFVFSYAGKEYCGFADKDFMLKEKTVETQGQRETRIFSFDLLGELTITLKLTHYFSHGVSEWTVWFENRTQKRSGVIENVYSRLSFDGENPVLKGILGDHGNQYKPYEYNLLDGEVDFSSNSGRATHVNFPYFNLEHAGGGTMLCIGWAGTWQAKFSANGEKTDVTLGAVNGLKTYLKPNEKIRSALFVVAPYQVRDEHYATNFWRSWFIECNLPKADATGADMQPFSTCALASDTGLPNSDGSISERHFTWRPSLEKMLAEDVKVDFRWFDAGWYVRPDGGSEETDWWGTVGTWQLDPVKWPDDTFLQSTSFARENGMKTLVWFEPERVTDPENLVKNFGYQMRWAIQLPGERAICNNIGDPDCFAWTAARVCKMLQENKVEMYREDNNCNAGALWKFMDEKEGDERTGITECKFIDGHYRLWDEFIACTLSQGGCGFVDSCASGGGRNDLESMRRGVPLLRSDSDRTTTALRLSMTSSFCKWIPFCGANTKEKATELALDGCSDAYVWRASYLPVLNVDSQFVYAKEGSFDILRFGLKEWKRVAPFLLKEFYPLTPWHAEKQTDGFTAFCYFDPEREEGALFAFRQETCEQELLHITLPFAGESAYVLTDEDTKETLQAKSEIGIRLPNVRSAKLFWLKKA